MAKTKAKDRIVLPDGTTTTLEDALDKGEVKLIENTSYDPPRYFARDRKDEVSWEVGKTLYLSRTGKPLPFGEHKEGTMRRTRRNRRKSLGGIGNVSTKNALLALAAVYTSVGIYKAVTGNANGFGLATSHPHIFAWDVFAWPVKVIKDRRQLTAAN